MAKILLIDDNLELTRLINLYLAQKYQTSLVFNIQQATQTLIRRQYDLVIIDRILPDGDGLDILKFMRNKQLLTPVLILSNKSEVAERVRGLRAGADDYLGKPFSMEELMLRVERLIQITKKIPQNEVFINRLKLYEKEGKVFFGQKRIELRPKEFAILLFLAKHRNQVMSRTMLIENLWAEDCTPTDNTVDVYIRRIRMLLGPMQSKYLKTFRHYGYILKEGRN